MPVKSKEFPIDLMPKHHANIAAVAMMEQKDQSSSNEAALSINMSHPQGDIEERVTTEALAEEERKVKTMAADKAEEERLVQVNQRADVLYHFFAYRYFDRSTTCLDLLNFSDADIDIFNLTANKTRGLNNWNVCAKYLENLGTPTPETNTQRRKLLYKIRDFNKAHPAHFRLYVRNMTTDDVKYLEGLSGQENKKGNTTTGTGKKPKSLIWATSLVEDEVDDVGSEGSVDGGAGVDHVEVEIKRCLKNHHDQHEAKYAKVNKSEALEGDLIKRMNKVQVEEVKDVIKEKST